MGVPEPAVWHGLVVTGCGLSLNFEDVLVLVPISNIWNYIEFVSFLAKIWAFQFVLKQGVPLPEVHVFALPCLCKVVHIKFLLVFHRAHQVTF